MVSFRYATIGLTILFAALSAGCFGATETDSISYVMILGVDKAENGKQKVTYQIAVPRAASGSTENKSTAAEKPWITNTITISTPADARMLLNSTTSRLPKSNHVTAYIFSEEIAREGIGPSLAYMARNRDYRETIYFIVVQGQAEEYIKKNQPRLETIMTRFYENILLSHNPGNYYLSGTFHQFYCRLKNNGGSPYASYTALNPMNGEGQPANLAAPEEKGPPYLPGKIPRTGTADNIDFLGLAVFRGDKMVGALDSGETMSAALLLGEFRQSYIDIVDPLYPKTDYISLNIYPEGKPKIIASTSGKIPTLKIIVKVSAEILGISSGTNYESPHYRSLAEASLANMLQGQILHMIKHTQELGTDPAGLGMYLRQSFSTTSDLEQIDLTDLYQKADIEVSVSAKIRRTGLIRQTTPIKKE